MEKKGLKDLQNLFKSKETIQQEELSKLSKRVEAFLADYRELVKKHGLDIIPQLQIIQVSPSIQPIQSLPI